ncbi:DUF4286 family protein [Lysobacter fragariae]
MSAATGPGVTYEVNVDLDEAIRADYLAWLAGHVEEILALPGFTGATILEVADPPAAAGRASLSMQYHLIGMDALEAYFRDHAPRLRADGVARFGERFRATRRVLRPLD